MPRRRKIEIKASELAYGGGIGIGAYTCEFWPLVDTLSPYSMENSFSDFVYFAQEVEFWLRIFAKKAESSELQGFMLLKNGVLNCQTKELLPFSPEYVFIEGIGTGVYEEGEDVPVIRLGVAKKYWWIYQNSSA